MELPLFVGSWVYVLAQGQAACGKEGSEVMSTLGYAYHWLYLKR